VQLLAVIASQAAVAIENARLYKRSQDSVRQMQALLDVAQTINQSLELSAVFDAILLSISDVIPNVYAALLLPDYDTHTLDIVDSLGPNKRRSQNLERLKLPFGQGISGLVFETGESIIVDDVREFPGFVDHGLSGVHSEMAVPLRRGESVVGVLDLGREGVAAFAQEEIGLLSLFASQAAIALENARLFAEQRRRVEELHTIQSIVRELTPLHDPAEICATVNRELKRLIDYHSCRLYLMDADTATLRPMSSGESSTPSVRVEIDRGFAGWIARTGEADVIPSTLNDPRPVHIPGTPRREESMIGAPLVYEGRVRGVITLSKLGTHQFDENDLRLLEIIGAQVAIAFDRARLYAELRREAITDPLVRLWNRRYLMERFREERLRAARSRRPLIALMLDIDKFKRVNDTYGHDAGDVVLQELARVVRAQTRAEDIVARYGGEEFCILLPETPLDEALRIAERLRVTASGHAMPASAGIDHVTFSIGVASWEPADVAEELFSRADLAMYAVKRRGGDGVCVAEGNTFRWTEPRPASRVIGK
jgi:diguanylate cyclase (GGDEF)-like protein